MRSLNYSEQIKKSEEELLALERKQTKGILRLRVRVGIPKLRQF
jgi:hypothetical protein